MSTLEITRDVDTLEGTGAGALPETDTKTSSRTSCGEPDEDVNVVRKSSRHAKRLRGLRHSQKRGVQAVPVVVFVSANGFVVDMDNANDVGTKSAIAAREGRIASLHRCSP
jgi:environmental stress-induced protein Ves